MFTLSFRQEQLAQEDTPWHETITQVMGTTQSYSHLQCWYQSSTSLSFNQRVFYIAAAIPVTQVKQ